MSPEYAALLDGIAVSPEALTAYTWVGAVWVTVILAFIAVRVIRRILAERSLAHKLEQRRRDEEDQP